MAPRPRALEATEVERVAIPDAEPPQHAVTVGSVHDPAEADADRLADRALALASSYSGHETSTAGSHSVQRSASADIDGLSVDARALASARSGGQALDGDVRSRLEHGFGTDLGAVRVHTGSEAAGIARQISARAFTHGSDVYFGAGEYRPGTADGDRVLAHEVAHTVQNGSAGEVQRFPATWSTAPVPWKPMTASVYRPGEGASGGVYILTSKDEAGPVKKAVVKPVSGRNGLNLVESGEQLQFSDAALGKLLGLNTPTSKVVKRGGSEFDDLVGLCKSKQPPPKPLVEGEQPEADLADAQSFVVMSEVPNASSIGSLADKAPNDRRASADLFRAVFDPTFLAELGKLCIGDLMLANPDRLVLGAMNLGNVMVSMQNGQARLAAIDTTAYLPKAVDPSAWAKSGGSGGGYASTLKQIDKGPGPLLDGFFETLVDRLKRATPVTAGPNPVWESIEATYKLHRDRFVADFEFGWTDAMITALALSDDDATINGLTSGYDDPEVTGSTLKANLNYLGSRAQGKSHNDSIGRSLAISASSWAKSIDTDRLVPTATDELAATNVTTPTGKAVDAEVVSMPSLPTPRQLGSLVNTYGNHIIPANYASMPKWPPAIRKATSEVNGQVSETKKRRSKPFGSKHDVPRNRSVVSKYVVHATAMGAGGARIADAGAYAAWVADQATPLLAADFRGNEAAPLKSLLTRVGASAAVVESSIASYKRQLATAATVVPTTSYRQREALAKVLGQVDTYLDDASKKLTALKQLDMQRVAAGIKAR